MYTMCTNESKDKGEKSMKEKIKISLIIFILVNLLLASNTFAVKIDMTPKEQEIKAGEELKFSVRIKDIDTEGLNSLQGKLIYDKKDWEIVKEEDIQSKNNWSVIFNSEDGDAHGTFIAINFNEKIDEEDIFEITLRAKQRIFSTNSEVELTNLSTTDGVQIIELEQMNSTIKVKGNEAIVIPVTIVIIGIIVVGIVVYTKFKKKQEKKEE